ncbi:Short-chain dehydrogenase TIC 32, chloroplastic [Gossypium arboreum]|uniref:Short-chain dehydrogenase TIC 32, chloroplastic n=1 Tax=Gossypium arboreum TaxID=29729 RepID=A0A0B0MSH5_GOSAR|nr:Short-chain dehydrogenase TIC 32, chloroplastic [Gossypium arboreum]
MLVVAIVLPCCFEILSLNCGTLMKETLRYLAGIVGPSGYGSKSTAEQVANSCSYLVDSQRLTAIITGATSGIGEETARAVAKRGVRVVIPARDIKKAAELKERIRKDNPNAEVILCEIDLSSLASVKRFCNEFLALGLPLNILINNAGIFSQKLEFSEDKFEMTFATNYLVLILPIYCWCCTCSYNGTRAYAQSKLATILHAKEIAKQLKAKNANVTINAVHPGIVKTGIFRAHKGFITGKNLHIPGASTSCYVALSPQVEGMSGKYFVDCNESNCSVLANDESEARRLWRQTRALIRRRLYQTPC